MKATLDRIEEIKTNGYQLDFGTVFEHAFENYKKIALYAGLILLVFSILVGIFAVGGIVLGVLGFSSVIDLETFSKTMKPENFEPQSFSVNFLAIYIFCIVLFTALLSPFTAGFLKMADCGEKGNEFNVSTIFSYYKSPYFKEIFVATFIVTLLTTGSSVLLDYSGHKFIGLLVSLPITFLTFMTIPLIVFGKLNAIDAIKSSIVVVCKQPLILLGLLIVASIASVLGFIGCCIGIFFTIPFVYAIEYCIYDAIIGVDLENETAALES